MPQKVRAVEWFGRGEVHKSPLFLRSTLRYDEAKPLSSPPPGLSWPMQDLPPHPHTQKRLSFMINGPFGHPSPELLHSGHSCILAPFLSDSEPLASQLLSRTHPGMQASPLAHPTSDSQTMLSPGCDCPSDLGVTCKLHDYFLKERANRKSYHVQSCL